MYLTEAEEAVLSETRASHVGTLITLPLGHVKWPRKGPSKVWNWFGCIHLRQEWLTLKHGDVREEPHCDSLLKQEGLADGKRAFGVKTLLFV